MWEKLVEFTQQLLSLKRDVAENTSELNKVRIYLLRVGKGTNSIASKLKLMEQKHYYEIQQLKESYTAEIHRLEDRLEQMEKRLALSHENVRIAIENQVLKATNDTQKQKLLHSAEANTSDIIS
ncbi:hypothetical protein U2F10_21870 [Leptothoe sp. EHU-05/26/07-4]